MNRESTRERVYAFIVAYKRDSGGASPSVREIAQGVGLASTSNIKYHLDRLAADGRIIRDAGGRARHISIPRERWTLQEAA
jgi:SOS-response transcriptional repressor LexA